MPHQIVGSKRQQMARICIFTYIITPQQMFRTEDIHVCEQDTSFVVHKWACTEFQSYGSNLLINSFFVNYFSPYFIEKYSLTFECIS